MATRDLKGRDSDPDSRQTTISDNRNSGVIAGRDIHGGVHLGSPPSLPAAEPAPLTKVPSTESGQALRILFLGANPQDGQALRLDVEVREIDRVLRQAEFRDHFDLRQQLAVRPTDLQAALLRHQPQIVHFSGHGKTDGICLEDETGQMREIPGNVIARILALFQKEIRCVVLNSCYSQHQAEAIAKTIDCVVGMSAAIQDRTGVSFAAAFYQALAFGKSVEMAFHLACAQINLDGLGDADKPQLIALRQDPRDIIFVQGDRR